LDFRRVNGFRHSVFVLALRGNNPIHKSVQPTKYELVGKSKVVSVGADAPAESDPGNLTPHEKYLHAIQAYENYLDDWKGVSIIVCTTP